MIGLRLEKHLDKVREQYKQQKEEEELRRKLYNSPHLLRADGGDNDLEGSGDVSVGTSEHTGGTGTPSPGGSPNMPPKFTPQVAPKPTKPTPAPKPNRDTNQTVVSSNGVVDDSANFAVQQQPYNPYPAPTQPAPPPHVSPEPSSRQPPQPAPRRSPQQGPPVPQPRNASPASPDKEALFVFAWYHGAIPRDEAVRRLEGMGGFDG